MDRVRVLLLWPGGLFSGGKNFGVPQLLSMAAAVQAQGVATVEIIDLDLERAFGRIDLRSLGKRAYDIVGLSCYSSYDYLKVVALAQELQTLLPQAWLVVGGYHPSARPEDFLHPDSPFHCVVVGEGERPLQRIIQARAAGAAPPGPLLGPDPLRDLQSLPPLDWTLLERYRPVARTVASQAEIYLSRGCPFGCSFCMERAKKEESWRALEPGAAVEALHRLDSFLDLTRFTLRVTDALFGLRADWRREVLARLAAQPLRARRIWLLTRLDLLERQDIELMARANVSPGFGLESGSPTMLRTIRKATSAQSYLDAALQVSEWALELDMPFGVNLIIGHPGETESTIRETAAFARRLFLRGDRTLGFLSVDPFRLYPGSDIDCNLDAWKERTGLRLHRYPWWHDGDQSFLSEWVDPSFELDYRTTLRLKQELFGPILREIPSRFCFQGPSRDYFVRAIDEQVELFSETRRVQLLGLWHLWEGLLKEETVEESGERLQQDDELSESARLVREGWVEELRENLSEAAVHALVETPRERFVPPSEVSESCRDRPLRYAENSERRMLPLKDFARLLSALELREGDSVALLGDGTGYCSAVCSTLVGESGTVLCVEAEAELADCARTQLRGFRQTCVVQAEPSETSLWKSARKVLVSYRVESVPQAWIAALAQGGVLVALTGEGVVRLGASD